MINQKAICFLTRETESCILTYIDVVSIFSISSLAATKGSISRMVKLVLLSQVTFMLRDSFCCIYLVFYSLDSIGENSPEKLSLN